MHREQLEALTEQELQNYLGIVAVSCGWWSASIISRVPHPKYPDLLILEFIRNG
jgi:hypothetical protein